MERSWDDAAGAVAPKSRKGKRVAPLLGVLRDHLDDWKLRSPHAGPDDFVFPGARAGGAFTPSQVRRAAAAAWAERAEEHKPLLVPIGLHECRHTCVSIFAAGGVPLERVGDYIGHSSTYMTDHYRHLIDGQREQDRRQLDDYLARADTAARIAALRGRRLGGLLPERGT